MTSFAIECTIPSRNFSRTRLSTKISGVLSPRRLLSGRRRGAARSYQELGKCLAEVQSRADGRERSLLSLDAAQPNMLRSRRAGRVRSEIRAMDGAHRHRKAVRPRPGQCALLNGRLQKCFSGKRSVSDRPLSGEGNGPEHHGVPLRNGIFEPLWNRTYIDHVQITAGRIDRRGRPRRFITRKPARSET